MKKIKKNYFVLFLILIGTSISAESAEEIEQPEEKPVYLGINIGSGSTSYDSADSKLYSFGGNSDVDYSLNPYEITLGAQLHKNINVELSYTKFGDLTYTNVDSQNIQQVYSQEVESFNIKFLFSTQFRKNVRLFVGVGGYNSTTKRSGVSPNPFSGSNTLSDVSHNAGLFELGANIKLKEKFGMQVKYFYYYDILTAFDDAGAGTADLNGLSIGLYIEF